MRFGKSEWSCFDRAIEREWLLTNGIGGFSSSTIIGANSRRYHGLLIASLDPPVARHLVLSQLHETILLDGKEYDLHSFSTGDYIKMGCFSQQSFELDPLPLFSYCFGDVSIEKTVALVYGENTVVIQYRIRTGAGAVDMKVAPLVNFRDYHGESSRHHMRFRQQAGECHTIVYPYDMGIEILIGCAGSRYEVLPHCWFEGMYYPVEQERGLNAYEDHYIPGIFHIRTGAESENVFSVVCTIGENIAVSMHDAEVADKNMDESMHDTEAAGRNMDASMYDARGTGKYIDASYGQTVIESEVARISKLTAGCKDDFHRALARSADHFIVYRRSTGAKTIIAGYPWFTDWGRDAMISLDGLTLSTGRYEEAAEILTTFSRYIKYGLVPNMFPDGGEEPGYNTVDAALWFFEAVFRYVEKTGDIRLVREKLYGSMIQIISKYRDGTLHGIHMDEDCLITAGNEDTQLTWMDAKADCTVFTPRHGKAVEINALWYNALKVMENISARIGTEAAEGVGSSAEVSEHSGNAEVSDYRCNVGVASEYCCNAAVASEYSRLAEKVKKSFAEVFWNEGKKCLYDVVNGDYRDESVRPNQILAVSLSFPVVKGVIAECVVKKVWKELYTPYGLRSLSPASKQYRGRYIGDRYARDSAYHQGTVWAWLIGHFITAFRRTLGREPMYSDMPEKFLKPFSDHLNHACLGSISEIFDGDEPLTPRGCFAQAWSVAEVLRAFTGS